MTFSSARDRNTEGPATSPEEPPFSLLILRGRSVSLLHWGGNPGVPSRHKRKRSPLDAREELQASCHHFKRTPMSQCTPDTPDSPALTRWSPGGAPQNTTAGVTALFPLKGKPPNIIVNPTGRLTAFPGREESGLAWHHTRRGPDSPVDAPEEA